MKIKNKIVMNALSKKLNKMTGERFNIQINELEIIKKNNGKFNTSVNADVDINIMDLIMK